VKNKRYTWRYAVTAIPQVVSPLSSFGPLDAGVKAVYLDRGFYDSKCLTLLQAHNYAYVILIIRWVRRFSKSSRVASFGDTAVK